MKDFKENFNLKDWKVHVLCLVIMVIAELIGTSEVAVRKSLSRARQSILKKMNNEKSRGN